MSQQLNRTLTAWDLTLMGIGAIIGAGIFVLTGIAAATQAGPSVIFSYLLAGVASSFAALCYAELAATYGGCGGAYSYAYASLGEAFAWMIGWVLMLEYGMDAATVSMGWSGYMQNALHAFGIDLPKFLTQDPMHGGLVNLPASLIILFIAGILTLGVKQSARFNNLIVFIKMSVIALFIAVGVFYFKPENWQPFLPFGLQGIVNGAGFIFFAYIGFDAVTTAAEETKNPKRDLPIGILGSLLICTIVYIIVAAVLTGMTYYSNLNVSSPVAAALIGIGHPVIGEIIAFGALAGLTSTIMAMYFGFSRVVFAMARDGMLPKKLVKLNEKTRTPKQLIWSIGIIMALIAGFFPINQIANLVNIGTLAAFVVVCAIVIILRFTQPDKPRSFKIPFGPLMPMLGIIMCIYLMSSLPLSTWISFIIWTLVGIPLYFIFAKNNNISTDVAVTETP